MEFLPLSRRPSSSRNVPSGEERWETDVFAGLVVVYTTFKWIINLKKNDSLFQLTWRSPQNLIIPYYMPSTQICPNETRFAQSGRVEAISGVGMFYRLFGEKSQKIEEWYANTRYRNFFLYLRKKNAGKSSLTYVQAPQPPPHVYILCSHVSGIVSANGSEAKEPQESGCSKRTTIFPSSSPCEF